MLQEMDFRFDLSGDIGTLSFVGSLTKDNTAKLKEALMLSLVKAEHVIVTFDNVQDVDEHSVNIICAAHRISGRMNKRLTFAGINKNMGLHRLYEGMLSLCAANSPIYCYEDCPWHRK